MGTPSHDGAMPRAIVRAHTRRMRSFLLALSVLVAACSEGDTRLPGTWLEEFEFDGRKVRRILALKQGGAFEQVTKVVEPGGSVRSESMTGDWYFDGETFKRRFRTVEGRPVSGIQFATYQVVSLTDTEMACVDHLTEGKRNVRFRRVPDGTAP